MTHFKHHWPGLLLLLVIAFVHYRDIPDKLGETAYLGWLYILLVAGCAAAGAWLLSSHWRNGYALGLLISAGAVVFYVLTRSVGLPHAHGDIGNWLEPAGVVAVLAELAFIALAASRLRQPAGSPVSSAPRPS